MKAVLAGERVPVKLWTEIEGVESAALDQLKKLSALPFVYHHVAVMPDVHVGIGATVGSVVATKGAVCPATVGVDIGCGMMALKTALKREQLGDLKTLRHDIERGIPVGFGQHQNPLPEAMKFIHAQPGPLADFSRETEKAAKQLGTLGGGNHFIELTEDEEGRVWIVLHSGSRGIGNQLATKFIQQAKGDMKKFFISLPDPDLAYFVQGTKEFKDYLDTVKWCQEYAYVNRELMMSAVLNTLVHRLRQQTGDDYAVFFRDSEAINCHHNYIALEHHFGDNVIVTRKGAIRAQAGDKGIIPGSMGAPTFIVEGLGNADAFNSAPHGAGRKMSRTRAKAEFTVEDLQKQTEGIESRKDSGVLDEIPGAYKPIQQVIDNSSDLVKVVAKLTQFLNIKG